MKIDPNDFRVHEGDDVGLGKRPTRGQPLCKSKKAYRKLLQEHVEQLSGYQELLYPSNSHARPARTRAHRHLQPLVL